jgi:hypothetical protein
MELESRPGTPPALMNQSFDHNVPRRESDASAPRLSTTVPFEATPGSDASPTPSAGRVSPGRVPSPDASAVETLSQFSAPSRSQNVTGETASRPDEAMSQASAQSWTSHADVFPEA